MRVTEEEFDELVRRGLAKPMVSGGIYKKPSIQVGKRTEIVGQLDELRKALKKSKYNAHKTKVDGICFDSKLEADYYVQLKLRQRAGDIKGFCRQPEFILMEGNDDIKPIIYKPDFIVFTEDGFEIIDTKGFETETFKIKHKLFKSRYPELKLKIER